MNATTSIPTLSTLLFAAFLLGTLSTAHAAGNGLDDGMASPMRASATMHVSVEVVDAASIRSTEDLLVNLNGETSVHLGQESAAAGRVHIPGLPNGQMALSIRGERTLNGVPGSKVSYEPAARVHGNVANAQAMELNGASTLVEFTESNGEGYRGVAELELTGSFDASESKSGRHTAVYTIVAEHL